MILLLKLYWHNCLSVTVNNIYWCLMQGQLLAHPDLDKTTLEKYGREGKKLLTEDFVNPDLQKLSLKQFV